MNKETEQLHKDWSELEKWLEATISHLDRELSHSHHYENLGYKAVRKVMKKIKAGVGAYGFLKD